jgi:hypothetical protein
MSRWLWLVGAFLAAGIGPIVLAPIDQGLIDSGWFPAGRAGAGFEGVLFAALFAASLARGWRRRLIGIVAAGLIAFFGLWGQRYLLGLSLGMDAAQDSNMTILLVHWTWMVASAGMGAWISRMNPSRGADWAVQLTLTLAAVVVADLLVGALGIDAAVINRVLYYQTVEIEVHEPVASAELLYGLKPGATLGGEGPWGLRTVRVNGWGARAPEYAAARESGVQRTLIFGGSTLYGAGVSNGDTTPGAMDRMLGPAHEVWNFGACAYNTTQSAHLAMSLMAPLSPDRIIIMITNTGRRAFMGGPDHMNADKSAYFDANPYLYIENFPPGPGQSERWHQLGLNFSALYRTMSAWARASQDPDTTFSDRADIDAVAQLEAEASAQNVEVLYVLSPSRGSEIGPSDLGVDAERWLDLNIPERSGDYQQAHPPPKVLSEYATAIVRWLKLRRQDH